MIVILAYDALMGILVLVGKESLGYDGGIWGSTGWRFGKQSGGRHSLSRRDALDGCHDEAAMRKGFCPIL